MNPRSVFERWAEKVVVVPNGCWMFHAHRNNQGYGMLKTPWRKGPLLAHRLSYELNVGDIPPGLCVCHSCDNPGCVNPSHLFLGSHTANMRDCVVKGRHRSDPHKGEESPSAKVTDAQVKEMRALRSQGYLLRELGALFGLKTSQVCRICRLQAR